MSLLREIQNDVAQGDGDITTVLRKCKILAARLGSNDLESWVNWELNGYPESQPIPEYRRLAANCYASFINIAWRANRQVVPAFLVPEQFRDGLHRVEFRTGVAAAASFVGKGARINRPEMAFVVQGKMYPDMECVSAWVEISGSEFEQLLSAVKNRVLDFALKLEAENPDAGEAPPNTAPVSPEKLRPLVQNTFYGNVGAIAQNSDHFGQTVNIEVSPQDIAKLATQFTDHIEELNLREREKERAQAQLTILKMESTGEPDPTIVRQAGQTLRNVTEGAIASLLAASVQPTIWHWIHQTLMTLSHQ